jgi:hypothetical protein
MHFVGELLLIGDGTRADELHDDERIRSTAIHRMDDDSFSGLSARDRTVPLTSSSPAIHESAASIPTGKFCVLHLAQ